MGSCSLAKEQNDQHQAQQAQHNHRNAEDPDEDHQDSVLVTPKVSRGHARESYHALVSRYGTFGCFLAFFVGLTSSSRFMA